MKSRPVLFSAFILLGMLHGCAPAAQIDATVALTPAVQVQANTPAPTQYPSPTSPPLATPVPSPTATPLPTLAVGERILAYEIRNNILTLRTPEAAETLTFPSDIVQVEAQGQNIRVTLADGTKLTLTWDKETGVWQEVQAKVYRELTELDPSKEAEMAIIQKAVHDSLAGGVFMGKEEIAEKIKNGELKVVKDETTGAVVVFTSQALEYMREKGQTLEASDFARMLNDYTSVVSDELWQRKAFKSDGSPDLESMKALAEKVVKFENKLIPLPPEVMSLTAVMEGDSPIVVASLPAVRDFSHGKPPGYTRLQLESTYRSDPILAVVYTLDGDKIRLKNLRAPYKTPFRWMRTMVLESSLAPVGIVDEFEAVTHVWDKESQQWQELDEYRVYGTPEERVAQALEYKLNEVRRVDSKNHTNVLGLDARLVAGAVKRLKEGESVAKVNEWLKAQTPEAGKASFYILASRDKETGQAVPAMVAVVGGEYGLDEEHFQAVLQAAKRLEEVDPGFLEETANQSGARFISARSSFMNFGSKDEDKRASANDFHDSIFVNTRKGTSVLKHEGDIIVESNEIKAARENQDILYMTDSVSLKEINTLKQRFPAYYDGATVVLTPDGKVIVNFGAYAMIKTSLWVMENQDRLSDDEIKELLGSTSYNYNHYIKDRLMKHLKDNGIPFSVVQ